MTGSNFLILSGHDYRSKRKASIHFIADEFAKQGPVRFFSVGYSFLSWLKKDPRRGVRGPRGAPHRSGGVESYLDRTIVHPVRIKAIDGGRLARAWLWLHAAMAPRLLKDWVQRSDVIILESGLSLIYFDLIKRLNPRAKTVYAAADRLETIGCSLELSTILRRSAAEFDLIRVPSPVMLDDFGPRANTRYIEQGFQPPPASTMANPYRGGRNAVSVGSMLFDADAIMALCRACPDLQVHVIGAGRGAIGLSAKNLTIYNEMSFNDTRPYIEYADIGVAPYDPAKVSPYLADTSLKLAQFGAAGVPAICPAVAARDFAYRFGYSTVDEANLRAAAEAALAFGRFAPIVPPTWHEVAERILHGLDSARIGRDAVRNPSSSLITN